MIETNTSLVRRVRDPQDSESWREFVTIYQPLLLNFVRKRGPQDAEAEAIVQEVLVSLWNKLPEFELDHSKGRFRGWLWRVTRNTVLSFYRARQRDVRLKDEYRQQLDSFEATDPDEPDEDFVMEQRRRVLGFAIERVRGKTQPRTWSCFEMHILKHLPAQEVAEELDMKVNAVYTNASRVLSKVRDFCQDYDEDLSHG
ncbi:MAG: sigma-70 family RNA polymerase sigma factor [Pirellulaceae bacterium]